MNPSLNEYMPENDTSHEGTIKSSRNKKECGVHLAKQHPHWNLATLQKKNRSQFLIRKDHIERWELYFVNDETGTNTTFTYRANSGGMFVKPMIIFRRKRLAAELW